MKDEGITDRIVLEQISVAIQPEIRLN